MMLHRIRLAAQSGSFKKLSGNAEVDETFIDGNARNMNKASVKQLSKGRVLAKVIERTDRETLHNEVNQSVETGANLFTDEWRSYKRIG